MFDGHIHIYKGEIASKSLNEKMKKADMQGGVLLSIRPNSFCPETEYIANEERLENLFSWCVGNDKLFPFYWIDPIEKDAKLQVKIAVEMGVSGFKIICNKFYPGDDRAMSVYEEIAKYNKPILFHSGILWDGSPSSCFNRPAEFEKLLEIDNLRFALAHISWPWCDELIAVYGKFLNAYDDHPGLNVEMFIDTTPGTPAIYRKEALTRLLTVGYDIEDNIIFGSDSNTGSYNEKWTKEWLQRDNEIYKELCVSKETVDKINGTNLIRFIKGDKIQHRNL